MTLQIVLYEPEIPANTGNVIRLAANAGAALHLVKPLGFTLRDKHLQRAGLDYHELASIRLHADWRSCRDFFDGQRLLAVSTRGRRRYDAVDYRPDDVLVFGPESRGLPPEVMTHCGHDGVIRIPMRSESRSINLANAVAIVLYEAWRQTGFAGGG